MGLHFIFFHITVAQYEGRSLLFGSYRSYYWYSQCQQWWYQKLYAWNSRKKWLSVIQVCFESKICGGDCESRLCDFQKYVKDCPKLKVGRERAKIMRQNFKIACLGNAPFCPGFNNP